MTWHEIKPKSHSQPSGRFDAQTWVDDQKHVWLYGGKRVIRINGSEVKQHLHDLWKFNPRSNEWSKIAYQNSSKQPQFNRGVSCFCRGKAFIFGQQIQKKSPELWVYNMSSNVWSLIPSNIKNIQGCLAMWCKQDSGMILLLCYENTSAVKLWIFKITSGNWSSQTFTNKTKFANTSNGNISELSQMSVWNQPRGLVYIYMWSHSDSSTRKNSVLLSISHDDVVVTKVNNTKLEYMSNRKGFIRWIGSHGNLHLLGGRITNSSAAHWMLNMSDYTWVTVDSKNHKPSSRAGACFWQVDGNLLLFGGYKKDDEGRIIVLNNFWLGNTSKPVVVRPTPTNRNLPGDTLGLSLATKLIISLVTLFVVMAVSIRLCYKRELNQLMSRLQKNQVLYHLVSQESDKSTRL